MKTRNTIFTTILVLFGSFVVSPRVQAFLPPPPVSDGGYLNNNIAEGTQALFKLTTGVDNAAVGFQALFFNSSQSNRNKSRPLTTGLQRVSDKLELSKPVSPLAVND